MWGGCQQPEYTQCEPYAGSDSGSGNIFVLIVVMFILLVIVLGSVFY